MLQGYVGVLLEGSYTYPGWESSPGIVFTLNICMKFV